jgi:methyl-accepting chemotaxis protein
MALVLVLGSAGAGWWSIDRLSDATKQVEVIGQALKNQQDADMMHDAIRGDVLAALLAAAQNDTGAAQEIRKDQQEHVAQFGAALDKLDALPLDAHVRAAAERVRPSLKAYELSAAQVLQAALGGNASGKAELAQFHEVFKQVEDVMEELSGLIGSQASLRLEQVNSLTSITRSLMAGVALFSAVLLFAVGAALARGIVRPIGRALAVAEAVASGDLSSRIEVNGADETGRLLQALQKMTDSLLNIVGQVRSATDSIAG